MSQIKQHSANGRNYTIVQVPKAATEIEVINTTNELRYETRFRQSLINCDYIDLPPGQYTLLFIAEDATEEQAMQVVETVYRSDVDPNDTDLTNGDWHSGYAAYGDDLCNHYLLSLDSCYSLIRSLFTEWKNYKHVILERHDTDK